MIRFLKNKYLHIFLALVLGLVLGFLGGVRGGKAALQRSYEAVDTFNTFAKYEIARDIASALKKKDYSNAKCLADLEASSGFDFVRDCMDNKQCASYIHGEVQKRTPEILSNTHSSFDYLPLKGNIRSCDSQCLTTPSSGTR